MKIILIIIAATIIGICFAGEQKPLTNSQMETILFGSDFDIHKAGDLLLTDKGCIYILNNWDRLRLYRQSYLKNYFSVNNFESHEVQRIVLNHPNRDVQELGIRNLASIDQEKAIPIPELSKYFKQLLSSENESHQLSALTFFSGKKIIEPDLYNQIANTIEELEAKKKLPTKHNKLKTRTYSILGQQRRAIIKCYLQTYSNLNKR